MAEQIADGEMTLQRIFNTRGGRRSDLYRVSQKECEILRESVPYVKLYRYNPKPLYPKLIVYIDNAHRILNL